jgi:putative oxidoreductase
MATVEVNRRDAGVDSALLVIRLALGAVFIAHGAQKFFVQGIAGTVGGFEQMGVPLPSITAPLVATVELAGGAAVLFGVATRLAALLLAIDMLGAIFIVHLPNGFFLPNGIEYALVLFSISLALVMSGAGLISIDRAMSREAARPEGALVVEEERERVAEEEVGVTAGRR